MVFRAGLTHTLIRWVSRAYWYCWYFTCIMGDMILTVYVTAYQSTVFKKQNKDNSVLYAVFVSI